MINGQRQEARGDSTSVPGWPRGSGAVSHPRAGPPSPQRLEGVGGGGVEPTPAPQFLCPQIRGRSEDRGSRLSGCSFFVVRLFPSPLGGPAVGGGGALGPAPKPSPGPAVSGHLARQPGSRGGTRALPARGRAAAPAAPTARPASPPGVCGPRPPGAPRTPAAAGSPASSSCRLWLKVCSCRSLVSPLVRRNLEMKDTAAAISPIMVAARV